MVNTRQKGNRGEREAEEILESVGYEVERPNYSRYGNKDFFNKFDFMAVKPDMPILLGQVKSNTASGINQFSEDVREQFPFDHIQVQYWVRHDREGWRIIEITESSREVIIDERDTDHNMGELVQIELSDDSQLTDF